MLPKLFSRSPFETLLTLGSWVESRPSWLRNGLFGALFIYAFAASRGILILVLVLLWMALTGHQAQAFQFLLVLLVVAPAGGFVGGLAYTAFEPLSRRLGAIGRFLQWAAAGAGYSTVLVYAVLPLMDGAYRVSGSPADSLFTIGFISVAIGVAFSLPTREADGLPEHTNWRFVGAMVAGAAVLILLMYLAGWMS
jgi:hypothetical protein